MEEEKTPNSLYLSPHVLEEFLLRLPLKSLGRIKSVSKEWKSILESKFFVERHLSLAKSGRKVLLAAYHCNCGVSPSRILQKSRFKGGQEFVYLHCDATRPSMSYDGLVCIPEAECVNVLNPSTGQLWRFHSPGLLNRSFNSTFPNGSWSTYFPGYCAMGFGRDSVKGSYKVVRMFETPNYCDILDVNTGQWRKLWKPRRFKVDVGRKSASVNGSIYWLQIRSHNNYTILALDLDKLQFHDVQGPPLPNGIMFEAQIVNIGDRLTIAMALVQLEIWSMDHAQEETWSKTHSISLASLGLVVESRGSFTPVTISKQGDVVFYDDKKRLFKFSPETDQLQSLSQDICVISPYIENLILVQTQQVEFRSGITCAKTMDAVMRRGNEFLCKGIGDIGSWLWENKIKLLASYLLAYFLCYYFCTPRNTVLSAASLTLGCWLVRSGHVDSSTIKTLVAFKLYDILTDLGFFGELV